MSERTEERLEEMVVLVDAEDREVGEMGKLAAHREGRLHRAFSVFLFNSRGELLLQKRAASKYHSPGLWSNTCCGHPRVGEGIAEAAERRLMEEMDLKCSLRPIFRFIYRADLADGMIEHELDHVLVGSTDADPVPNAEEVSGWRWSERGELEQELRDRPERSTAWFPLCAWRAWDHFEQARTPDQPIARHS